MDFRKITVIGGGIMGSGIAQVIATSGINVTVEDAFKEALDKSKRTITESLGKLEGFIKAGYFLLDQFVPRELAYHLF